MTYLGGIVAIAAAMLVAALLQVLVSRFVSAPHRKAIHEVGGLVFLNAGVFYALLLAFMLTIAWTRFDEAGEAVRDEAAAVYRLAAVARTLHEPLGSQVRRELEIYASEVIVEARSSTASPAMESRVDQALRAAWSGVLELEPRTTRETISRDEMVRIFDDLRIARVTRAGYQGSSVPPLLWTLAVVGGIGLVLIAAFFDMESDLAHASLTALFAGILSFGLVTVAELDHPFEGDLVVSIEPFVAASEALTKGE